MTAPLDLTKPIMLPHDKKPWRVVYCDGASVLVDGGSLNARIHHTRQYIDEYAKNIPPEPPKPVGYDEFDAWLASQMPQNTVIGDPHWWTPKIVRAAIRYLRADLPEDPPGSWSATDPIRSRLPRKVKPLTVFECDLIIEASNHQHSYTRSNVRAKFNDILAERGIEVGE